MSIILETMVSPTRDLFSLLLVLDTLEFPTRPHPSLNPHVSVLTSRVMRIPHWDQKHT